MFSLVFFLFFDSKILQHIQPERTECRERLEKIQQQIKWTTFPGVQTLLLKVRRSHVLTLRCLMRVSWWSINVRNICVFQGFTSSVTMEGVWSLLSRLTISITAPVVDPTENLGKHWLVILLYNVLIIMISGLAFLNTGIVKYTIMYYTFVQNKILHNTHVSPCRLYWWYSLFFETHYTQKRKTKENRDCNRKGPYASFSVCNDIIAVSCFQLNFRLPYKCDSIIASSCPKLWKS